MLAVLDQAQALLDSEHTPDGYNIGINDGDAAGQTVMHLHIHIVPRYRGDKADPRGGIRALFPERGRLWRQESMIVPFVQVEQDLRTLLEQFGPCLLRKAHAIGL